MGPGSFLQSASVCEWAREQHERTLVLEKLGNSALVPIFVSMAIYGLVPIRLKKPFVPGGGWISSTKVYCIAMMGYVLFTTGQMSSGLLHHSLNAKSLTAKLHFSNAIVALLPISFIPLLWVECCTFFDKAMKCCKYEVLHLELTKIELHWKGLYRRNVIFVVFFHALVAVVLQSGLCFRLPWRMCLTYAVSVLFQLHVSLWFSTWLSQIRAASDSLLVYIEKGVDESCSLTLTTRLRNGRRLWVELREMLEGKAILRAMVALIQVFLYWVVVLSLYQTLHYGNKRDTKNTAQQATICFAVFVQLYYLCDASHKCTCLMNDRFIASLDRLSLTVGDMESRQALNLFFYSITTKPFRVSLGGFTSSGRPLISTVVSGMVTFLVILVQFQSVVRGSAAVVTASSSFAARTHTPA